MPENFKKILLGEKEVLLEELSTYKKEDPLLDPTHQFSNTFDDAIGVAEGHDRIVATRLELKQRLAEIEGALERIDNGTFGFCLKCSAKISEARLKALPTANFCVDHQR